ncbi:TRAP transporter small permease [Chloroflexota bacterium]
MGRFQRIAGLLNRFVDGLTFSARSLGEACVLVLIGLIFVDVFGRYILDKPTKIADELGGYLLLTIVFMGAAYAMQRDLHINVTVLSDRLPIKARRWLNLTMEIVAIIFVVITAWLGAQLVGMSLDSGTRAPTTMRTPTFIPQLVVPIGLGVFALEMIRQFIRQVRRKKTPELSKMPESW